MPSKQVNTCPCLTKLKKIVLFHALLCWLCLGFSLRSRPLAAVWLPLSSSLVSGGIYQISRMKNLKREAEGGPVSGRPSELSYRCYDLSSCLFPLVFSVSPFFPFALGALGGFIVLIRHWFFSLLFFLVFICSFFSFWVVIFVILSG